MRSARGSASSAPSILLFDADGVMRFKAYRWLSDAYRRAVEGHTPWTPDSPEPQPIVVADVRADDSLAAYRPVLEAEGIAAMTFIPLVSLDRVIGKFMLDYSTPAAPTADELQLACADRRAGRLCGRADPRRGTRAAQRGAAPLRARRRVDGHVGLGSHHQHRAVVRQPRPDPRPAAGLPSTAPSPATSGRFIPTIARGCSPRCSAPSPKASRTTSSTASSRPTAPCAGARARDGSSIATAGRWR